VNCKIDKLDPAITRPGRLLAYHEFSRLGPEQAWRLAEAKSLNLVEQDDYSLAEIYCRRVNNLTGQRPTIGFAG